MTYLDIFPHTVFGRSKVILDQFGELGLHMGLSWAGLEVSLGLSYLVAHLRGILNFIWAIYDFRPFRAIMGHLQATWTIFGLFLAILG